jgi:hypothetical protein
MITSPNRKIIFHTIRILRSDENDILIHRLIQTLKDRHLFYTAKQLKCLCNQNNVKLIMSQKKKQTIPGGPPIDFDRQDDFK